MVRSEADPLRQVLVCPPGPEFLGVRDGEAHSIPFPADPVRVREQYRELTGTMAEAGAAVVEVPELEGHPNSLFTRDSALVVDDGYVRLRMGLPTRRGEEAWMASNLAGLGLSEVGRIGGPGSPDPAATLEGGDVILAGNVAFVGLSDRSNRAGVEALEKILSHRGFQVRVAPIPPTFMHIGGAMSLVAPDAVLACPAVFADGFFEGFRVIGIPCARGGESGANVICLGPGEVVANLGDGPEAPEALASAGIRVHGLDLSEYRKGDGGPTCMILPLDRGS